MVPGEVWEILWTFGHLLGRGEAPILDFPVLETPSVPHSTHGGGGREERRGEWEASGTTHTSGAYFPPGLLTLLLPQEGPSPARMAMARRLAAIAACALTLAAIVALATQGAKQRSIVLTDNNMFESEPAFDANWDLKDVQHHCKP